MLGTFHKATSRVGRTLPSLVALGAVAVLVLPAIYLATVTSAVAEDAQRPAYKDPVPEFLPKPTLGEERILVALEEPAELNFAETPLQQAADMLAERHKIEVQVDRRALEDAAIGGDTPVSRRVSNVKLKSALDLLLHELGLTYIIKNEVLWITTPDRAESELLVRTYPVGDLVEQPDAETLITAIRSTLYSQTWSKVGGPASIVYVPKVRALVIAQTREVHGDVLELLRALRGVRHAAN